MCEHNRTLHRLTPSITSYIHTKTTTGFFSTTDYADGTDFIKADLHLLFLNTNHSNGTNLFFALTGRNLLKIFWKSLEPGGSEINFQTEHWEFNCELSPILIYCCPIKNKFRWVRNLDSTFWDQDLSNLDLKHRILSLNPRIWDIKSYK